MGKVYGERWKIVESLDQGGQGRVFLAEDARGEIAGRVVVKDLLNLKRVSRFEREVGILRTIAHPNVLRLIDADVSAQRPYLVTEYCSGGNLQKCLPSTRTARLDVFDQLLEGMATVHDSGVVHRDLKPANLFLRDDLGQAVIGDFGLAFIPDEERLTEAAEAVGPRLYMAPELEDGLFDDVAPSCDVYSLGKVLYYLLSGGRVFSREKHREPNYDLRLKEHDPRNEHLNRLLDVMIAHEPKQRIPTAQEALSQFRGMRRVLEMGYNAVSREDRSQLCTYCGQGFYAIRADEHSINEVRNFGIEPRGTASYVIMVCQACGHLQLFRPDLAARREWWAPAQAPKGFRRLRIKPNHHVQGLGKPGDVIQLDAEPAKLAVRDGWAEYADV